MNNYWGCTENELKTRVATHRSTFNNSKQENATELSKEIHSIRRLGQEYNVMWNIVERAKAFKPGDDFCRLCNLERYIILFKSNEKTLNNFRVEQCYHKRKIYLSTIKWSGISVMVGNYIWHTEKSYKVIWYLRNGWQLHMTHGKKL